MATRRDFCGVVLDVFRNHGVYIGGANGENVESLTIGKIRKLEEGYAGRDHASDINRDLCFIGKCYKLGYSMREAIACDCSGLAVYALRLLNIIKQTADYRAAEFQTMADPIPLKDLQEGDFVFDKLKDAAHMGIYTGDGYVVESKGRDAGVVKRKVSEGSWKVGGRLNNGWFDKDIPVLTRNLRYIKDDMMKGKDVEQCQEQLIKKGYNPGVADGIYGRKTELAVIDFQADNNLDVDGVVGQKTWATLWEEGDA